MNISKRKYPISVVRKFLKSLLGTLRLNKGLRIMRNGAKIAMGNLNTEISITYSETKLSDLLATNKKNGERLEKN
jgi:hypothetical protein